MTVQTARKFAGVQKPIAGYIPRREMGKVVSGEVWRCNGAGRFKKASEFRTLVRRMPSGLRGNSMPRTDKGVFTIPFC